MQIEKIFDEISENLDFIDKNLPTGAKSFILKRDLRRFISVERILSHFWIFVSGILFLIYSVKNLRFIYGIQRYSISPMFVFGTVFAYVPIIASAFTGKDFGYSRIFYIHLIPPHLSLMMMLSYVIASNVFIKKYATLSNALLILLFFLLQSFSIKNM